jgi:hypothetical protein
VKGPRSGVEENVASAAPAPIGTVFGAGHVHAVTPTPRTRWWPGVAVGAGLFAVVLGLRPQLLRDSVAEIQAPTVEIPAAAESEVRVGEGAGGSTTGAAGEGSTSTGAGTTSSGSGAAAAAPPERSPPGPSAEETPAEAKPKSSRSGMRATARGPAQVRFRVPGGQKQQFYYVRLRRRGGAEQEFVAEPRKDLELAPGSYTVEIRNRPADAWRGNKQIDLQGGREYEVRLTEAGIHMAAQG